MTGQLAFFRDPQARGTDPGTSHEAAAAATPHAGAREHEILVAFATYGSMTDDEMCEVIPHVFGPTLRTARSRLTKCGSLIPTGETRLSARGRRMQVWKLSPGPAGLGYAVPGTAWQGTERLGEAPQGL